MVQVGDRVVVAVGRVVLKLLVLVVLVQVVKVRKEGMESNKTPSLLLVVVAVEVHRNREPMQLAVLAVKEATGHLAVFRVQVLLMLVVVAVVRGFFPGTEVLKVLVVGGLVAVVAVARLMVLERTALLTRAAAVVVAAVCNFLSMKKVVMVGREL
jgi:hypothetical protein